MEKHAKQIFWNTILLTAATLLVRTVGVSFQVFVSNRAGAEAMGLFSLLSGVYGFALTLATSGIHLGVTHLIVDAIGRGQPGRIAPAMRRATLYALFFGVGSSLLLSAFAETVGTVWLKDVRTVSSLRLLALSLPLISLSSAFGGYFTAVRRTFKNATVQVFEQAIKIGATMYLLAAGVAGDVEKTCCALVLGGALAEVASFLLNMILFLYDKRRHFPQKSNAEGSRDGILLLKTSLPVALTAYARSGLVTLEHILIPEGLRNSGSSHGAALVAYGSIHSMALPIIFYPAALISSCAGLLVPEIAECHVRKCTRRIGYMISRVWWLSLVFSIAVAGILIFFSEEIGETLYPGTDTGRFIRLLAPLIPIMYIDTATDAVMKGLGEQIYSMKINIADALISVILVWLLIPRYGIEGYLFTIYFSESFNTVLSISHLLSITSPKIHPVKWVIKPLLAIVGATTTVHLLLQKSGLQIEPAGLSIAVHILLVLVVYLVLLLLLGGVDREDAEWFASLFCKKSRTRSAEGSDENGAAVDS
ncbi:MAG: polysaccharide biosynthesis protein [Clostridia bacterium]|nr:polysaccharide biosynthesis protein [Clostridia bacterium]